MSINNTTRISTKVQSAISRLTLVNFRNYKYQRINANKQFIIFAGENGSGKTNLLEAISFLSQGRGFRGAKLSDIKTFDFLSESASTPIFINNNGWAVSANIIKNGETYNIGTATQTNRIEQGERTKEVEQRTSQVNNQKITSQSQFLEYISIIWLTPQMDRLFLSSAQNRRSFLDRIVSSFDTNHSKSLSAFDNLYRQRLHILKSENINNKWLDSIEEKLSELGVAIAASRNEQILNLNNFIENNPDDIFPEAKLILDGAIEKMLEDKPAIFVEEFYRNTLKRQRNPSYNEDNNIGINKTDLKAIYIKKNVPANLCSTGEQKALILSIILAHSKCLIKNKKTYPILLLDEISAHLDNKKKDALLNKISELGLQTWITTTNIDDFSSIKDVSQYYKIRNNEVTEII